MLKKITASLLIIFVLLSVGCEQPEKAPNYNVVASFYPVYIFTLNLLEGIERVSLFNMTDGQNSCLHDYQLTTGDMKLLADADLLIINGADMEGFIEKSVSGNEALNIVDSSKGVTLLEGECHHEGYDHHDHEHGVLSHIWLSVPNAIMQVDNIYKGLLEELPGLSDELKANRDRYVESLEELHAHLQVEAEKLTKSIVTFHSAYEYFSQEYGLPVLASIETDTGAEPSARELGELVSLMETEGVRAIFIEPDYAGTSADIVARETGAKLYTLNPITGGEDVKDSYEKIMRENMQTLLQAQEA